MYIPPLARRNHTRINAEVTDQRSGGSRVDPGCGGNSPHPMANYLESKILVNDGYWKNVSGGPPISSIQVIIRYLWLKNNLPACENYFFGV